MGRKGRPQKPGKRRNGRPVVDHSFDRGSDWVQAQRSRFGEHYGSAIGRAYAAGLLGDLHNQGALAKDRLSAAKKFARAYQRIISQDRYRCALDRTPRGNLAINLSPEATAFEMEEQDWLFRAMDTLDRTGCRPYLDQLLSVLHTDHGPHWLDNLLRGSTHPADAMILNAALQAIDAITPQKREGIIRVVRS